MTRYTINDVKKRDRGYRLIVFEFFFSVCIIIIAFLSCSIPFTFLTKNKTGAQQMVAGIQLLGQLLSSPIVVAPSPATGFGTTAAVKTTTRVVDAIHFRYVRRSYYTVRCFFFRFLHFVRTAEKGKQATRPRYE